jgi:hypothetical protein
MDISPLKVMFLPTHKLPFMDTSPFGKLIPPFLKIIVPLTSKNPWIYELLKQLDVDADDNHGFVLNINTI